MRALKSPPKSSLRPTRTIESRGGRSGPVLVALIAVGGAAAANPVRRKALPGARDARPAPPPSSDLVLVHVDDVGPGAPVNPGALSLGQPAVKQHHLALVPHPLQGLSHDLEQALQLAVPPAREP